MSIWIYYSEQRFFRLSKTCGNYVDITHMDGTSAVFKVLLKRTIPRQCFISEGLMRGVLVVLQRAKRGSSHFKNRPIIIKPFLRKAKVCVQSFYATLISPFP